MEVMLAELLSRFHMIRALPIESISPFESKPLIQHCWACKLTGRHVTLTICFISFSILTIRSAPLAQYVHHVSMLASPMPSRSAEEDL